MLILIKLKKCFCNWIAKFAFSYPKYTAPEVFLSPDVSSPKVDSWSLGIIIAELLLAKPIWPGVKLSQCLRKILSLLHCETSIFERLARETNCYNTYKVWFSELTLSVVISHDILFIFNILILYIRIYLIK